jgi:hypothetical protein
MELRKKGNLSEKNSRLRWTKALGFVLSVWSIVKSGAQMARSIKREMHLSAVA